MKTQMGKPTKRKIIIALWHLKTFKWIEFLDFCRSTKRKKNLKNIFTKTDHETDLSGPLTVPPKHCIIKTKLPKLVALRLSLFTVTCYYSNQHIELSLSETNLNAYFKCSRQQIESTVTIYSVLYRQECFTGKYVPLVKFI